jgi:hypothetical protein
MDTTEQKRFDKMEVVVEKIQSDVNEIKAALLGNELSGERGLKGQIESLKLETEAMKIEIRDLREERVENAVYILIIKGLFAVFASAIAAYFISK